MISDEQFAETINKTGGASRHWLTYEEPPKRGYMISEPGHEAMHTGPATEDQVAEHFHEHNESLPVMFAKNPYQGGWSDKHPETGEPTTYLDVSTRHGVNWHRARGIAEEKGQFGAYHLPTGETHYTHRQMPGPQADPDWESKPKQPSKYEKDSPELQQHTGLLNGEQIPLEHVMRTIAAGRMARSGHGR